MREKTSQKTSQTRELGAHKVQEVRIQFSTAFYHMLTALQQCERWKLFNCQLFRIGLEYRGIIELTDWASSEIRRSTLKSTTLPSFRMDLDFRKFVPKKDDVLERSWVKRTWGGHEETESVKITPYAIADMTETAKRFQAAVQGDIWQYLHDAVEIKDTFLYEVYEFAKQHLETELVGEIPYIGNLTEIRSRLKTNAMTNIYFCKTSFACASWSSFRAGHAILRATRLEFQRFWIRNSFSTGRFHILPLPMTN